MLSLLRLALRSLARTPRFTLITILTLAVGIGSAAAIFSVADWVLFGTSKFSGDIYLVGGRSDQGTMPIRYDYMVRGYAEEKTVFTEFATASYVTGNVAVAGHPISTSWLGITPNLLPMLGIQPVLGRGFLPGENTEGRDQVVIVSHAFWKRHLGGNKEAIGRQLRLGNTVCTVVGVLREGQNLPAYFINDIYRPLGVRVTPDQPWNPNFFLLGKVRAAVSREQATQALDAMKLDVPPLMRSWLVNDHPTLSSLAEVNNVMHPELYWTMMGAVGFLYAIACLNASNLMLIRLLGRRREQCIRLALGSSRLRLLGSLALESLLLAAGAAAVGTLIANWLFPLLLAVAGSSEFTADWGQWNLNNRVVAILGLLSLVTTLAILIVPGFRLFRINLNDGLKDGGAALGESPGLARLRGMLVVLQAAFAVILLSGAALMVRTFHQLQQVDLGFDPSGRAKVQINFPPDYPAGDDERLQRLREIQAELLRVPGVRAVGFGDDVLLPGYFFASQTIEGPNNSKLRAAMVGFSRGYQDAAGLALKRGQWLTESKGNSVLVNEALARACWPDQDPVGQFLRPATMNTSGDWKGWQVAGVVGDLRQSVRESGAYYIYIPEGWGAANHSVFILRIAGAYDEALAGLIRRKLYSFDDQLVVSQITSLENLRNSQLWAERLANSVLKVLACIALLLTLVGLFSVITYTVDCRMNEFGVRAALGATGGDLAQLVLRKGLVFTLAGALLGCAGALVFTRSLQSLLFNTSPQEPWILVIVAASMVLTAGAACVLPAVRASRADVSRLLKAE